MTESPEYYEILDRRLRELDDLVEELVEDLVGWYREYLNAGEYGLAVEIVAERLTSDMPQTLVTRLAAGLLAAADVMGLHDVVSSLRALAEPAA